MKYPGNSKRIFLKQFFGFLTVVGGGFILWTVRNYFFFRSTSNATTIGVFSQFRKNQIIHRKSERFFLIYDVQGLYAVSDACSHRGCMLRSEGNQLACPCHGAIFTLDGKPVSGPANKPLDHYYIYKNEQNLLAVDVTQIVSKDFRYSE